MIHIPTKLGFINFWSVVFEVLCGHAEWQTHRHTDAAKNNTCSQRHNTEPYSTDNWQVCSLCRPVFTWHLVTVTAARSNKVKTACAGTATKVSAMPPALAPASTSATACPIAWWFSSCESCFNGVKTSFNCQHRTNCCSQPTQHTVSRRHYVVSRQRVLA